MSESPQTTGEAGVVSTNVGRSPSLMRWYLACIALVVVDQLTKLLIRQNLQLHESIPVIGSDFLRLTYVQNRGIAFGVDVFSLTLLIGLGVAAILFLSFYLAKLVHTKSAYRWPVLLFLAGAIGNTVDRVLFGRVTDFVDFDFPDIIMERWPVFNVADSCVTIGMIVMILILMFEHKQAALPSSSTGTPRGGELGIIPAVEDHVRPFSTHEGRIPSPTDPLPRDNRTRPKPTAD